MRRLYSLALWALLPVFLVRLWWRGVKHPSYRQRWRERLGWYDEPSALRAPLWIHAVSVGEVSAAAPLVKALRTEYPTLPILLTTTTPTGFDNVARVIGDGVVHAFFPYDFAPAVCRFLTHFAPRALCLMETELWPNVIHHCHARRIPVFLINGRLSAKSARRYRFWHSLSAPMLRQLSGAAMQSSGDAERVRELGARAEVVEVTGSLKFDVSLAASVHEEAAALRRELGSARQIVMAGSTRPGEENALLEIYRALKVRFNSLLLVLAPRHPERFTEVAELCRAQGMQVQQRQRATQCGADVDIFLLDTMGELGRFYAASDVAFVGGSLVPLGGHNLLEPAALGVPVVTGPHLFNFEEIAAKLQAGGALMVGRDTAEVIVHLTQLLADSDARDRAGRRGAAIVDVNRGATHRAIAMLKRSGVFS